MFIDLYLTGCLIAFGMVITVKDVPLRGKIFMVFASWITVGGAISTTLDLIDEYLKSKKK